MNRNSARTRHDALAERVIFELVQKRMKLLLVPAQKKKKFENDDEQQNDG